MTDTADKTKQVLVIGATSGIARAVCKRLAQRGYGLVLAGRDQAALEADAADLRVRHQAEVEVRPFDALAFETHGALVENLNVSVAIVCHGVMISNEAARASIDDHRRMIDINYTSYVSALEVLADYFEPRGTGVIAALSSVAGDRGRPSNYCYGATKAAVSTYLAGLRGRLNRKGVSVVTIKPGPVATPMTQGLQAKGPTAQPEVVAKQIVSAIEKRRNVAYVPLKWWPIMSIIRLIPEWLFKKANL